MTEQWTVGRLREALAAYPDDTPVTVCVPEGDDFMNEYTVTDGPSFGRIDWGDGRGEHDDISHVMIEAYEFYCRPARGSGRA